MAGKMAERHERERDALEGNSSKTLRVEDVL